MQDSVEKNLKDYFFEMKLLFQEQNDLNSLTELLGANEFTETKPYLIRRKLTPKDNRFKSIELVYEKPELVKKICWDIDISLAQLREYFGNPRFHYAPHGSATMIGFFDLENQFTGFETIYPGDASEKDGKYELNSEDGKFEVKDDLRISFVSFDIERMKNEKLLPTMHKSNGGESTKCEVKTKNKSRSWLKRLWP